MIEKLKNIEKIENIYCKATVKAIWLFNTKLLHFQLIIPLNNIIDFAFNQCNKKYTNFSGIMAFWCNKLKYLDFFIREN